ncbi:paired amphipathic helix Sin3-like protein [Rhynchospora pubera]|uniref:Paired amphipathic helix Sin3-like protein n=1 Tax=Rhynchospora pubera TaxID=906938 RepID=A0AAV8DBS1_9POAL|nr:paired amphipathic helix Sin3-like protein [Rhynchospora pubera]
MSRALMAAAIVFQRKFLLIYIGEDVLKYFWDRSKNNTTTKDALEYLTKVREAFKETPDLYAEFLQIMKDFKSNKIGVHEVKDKVVNLFCGHDDLLLGFNVFLPEEHTIRIPTPVPKLVQAPKHLPVNFDEAMSFVNKIKSRFVDEPSVFNSFLKILNLYKTNHKKCEEIYQEVEPLFKGHPDLLSGFKRFLPPNHPNIPGWQAGSISRDDWNSAMTSLKDTQPVKNEKTSQDSEGSDRSEGEERESNPDTKKTNCVNGSQSTPDHMPDKDKELLCDEAIFNFFKRVRERLEPVAYQDFLKCVDLQRVGAFTKETLEMLASGLFVDYPDLIDGFKEIILAHGSKDGAGSSKGENEEEREEEKREKERERSERRIRTPPLLAKEKFNLCKPVSELDLSGCEQCTPSYRLLPKHYPVPPSTQRTELGKSVLNDAWVSVTSGSEDYSFKHMRKNQYEESLFRCEDDRFELDMLVESAKSAIKRVEKLIKKMNEGSIDQDEPIDIEDYLTPMNMRCIEKLYGDHGLDAIEVLRRKPEAALPVLLGRLKQKLEEWNQCRIDFNKVWADVYAKNYHKSLDHRSFYFKQQDMKNLSCKALQAEVNERHEKKLGEDAHLLEIGAEAGMSGAPDMQFDFLDLDLHEDLYQVIKYSCDEVFSLEQSRQVMHLWTFFLEHFLGVESQHHKSEISEEQVNSKSEGRKACIVRVGDSTGNGTVADESSKTASPGATDAASLAAGAQRKGFGGPLRKSGVTMDAVARHLSGNRTSSPTHDGEKRTHLSSSPKVGREEEREEGEILPELGDSDEENSLSSETGNGIERGEEASGSSEKDGNEEEEGELDHQEKMESEGEADTWDMTNSPSSHAFTVTARPLSKHWTSTRIEKENRVFYGDGHFYVLFRLHQIFYERMLSAKNNSMDEEKRQMASKGGSKCPDLYSSFKRALHNLLDGSSESAKFEDECRATCGTHSYVLFTLDKLIFKIVKQLQVITSDETSKKLLQLYYYEKSHRHGQIVDHVYYENARAIVNDEALYRLESGSKPSRLLIQLKDMMHANSEPALSKNPKFGGYLSFSDHFMCEQEEKEIQGVYLKRCKRKIEFLNGETFNEIRLHNGLECKVSWAQSKVVYVLHTEDFMYRKCKRRRHSENEMSIS